MSMMGQSTVGAGKSGAQSGERFGPDNPMWWVVIIFVASVLSPTTTLVAFGVGIPALRRRVRASRLLVAHAVAAAVMLVVAGGNPFLLLRMHADGWLSVMSLTPIADTIPQAVDGFLKLIGQPPAGLVVPEGVGLMGGLALMLPFGVPTGLLLVAVYAGWSAWRRNALRGLEGPQYDFTRPYGILDEIRRQRSVTAIQSMKAVRR